jgi:hypothetical protein
MRLMTTTSSGNTVKRSSSSQTSTRLSRWCRSFVGLGLWLGLGLGLGLVISYIGAPLSLEAGMMECVAWVLRGMRCTGASRSTSLGWLHRA